MTPVPGYRTEAELGRGRCAQVYRAIDITHGLTHGRTVALKVARRAQLVRMGRAADFSAEFAALSAGAHRHVVQAYSHGISGDTAYLAMEVAAHGPFGPRGSPLHPVRLHALAAQAAAALGRLHQQGWVHRDVKPANFLLRADGGLALADFGNACRVGEGAAPQPGRIVGTPLYAAPEQSAGATALPSADVYSLGVVLYEVLAGRPPYPGETLTELFCQHQLAPVPRLPQAQQAWQGLIDAMLAKAPAQRLADGAAVVSALAHLRGGLQ